MLLACFLVGLEKLLVGLIPTVFAFQTAAILPTFVEFDVCQLLLYCCLRCLQLYTLNMAKI